MAGSQAQDEALLKQLPWLRGRSVRGMAVLHYLILSDRILCLDFNLSADTTGELDKLVEDQIVLLGLDAVPDSADDAYWTTFFSSPELPPYYVNLADWLISAKVRVRGEA